MGFMKQGITLMGAVCLLIFVASWLNIDELLIVLPILWCYSFFHVHNLNNLPDEEFYAIEDDYLFHLDRVLPKGFNLSMNSRKVLAGILIIIGAIVLWDNLTDLIYCLLPEYLTYWYWEIISEIPRLMIGVVLIAGGLWLIRGKKKELDTAEEQKEGESL